MAFWGQNITQPTQVTQRSGIIVSAVLVSAVFAAAVEPAAFKSKGDAIAAELTIMNFLLVKP
jgi:hypothetical protein